MASRLAEICRRLETIYMLRVDCELQLLGQVALGLGGRHGLGICLYSLVAPAPVPARPRATAAAAGPEQSGPVHTSQIKSTTTSKSKLKATTWACCLSLFNPSSLCLCRTEEEREQERNMDDDDDKLVSHEVHLRQLSSTPMSALQLRRQSKSLELAKQEQETQQGKPEPPSAASPDEVDQGVVLRRAVKRGPITLAQIEDLKLSSEDFDDGDGDGDDVDVDGDGDGDADYTAVGGLSNPAVHNTSDEQITAKVSATAATGASPGEVSSICGQRPQHSGLIKNKT